VALGGLTRGINGCRGLFFLRMVFSLDESIINHFKIDGTEKISGNHVQSVTMAVHSPEMHLIANPVLTC